MAWRIPETVDSDIIREAEDSLFPQQIPKEGPVSGSTWSNLKLLAFYGTKSFLGISDVCHRNVLYVVWLLKTTIMIDPTSWYLLLCLVLSLKYLNYKALGSVKLTVTVSKITSSQTQHSASAVSIVPAIQEPEAWARNFETHLGNTVRACVKVRRKEDKCQLKLYVYKILIFILI